MDVTVVSATQARKARMSQSSGVRRMRPPLRSMSQAQAPSATSPNTRSRDILTMSNTSKVKGVCKRRKVRLLIATGTRNTMTSSAYQETRRALLMASAGASAGAAGRPAGLGAGAPETCLPAGRLTPRGPLVLIGLGQPLAPLPGSAPSENHAQGLGHDLSVHGQGLMIHVDEVVLELALGRGRVAAADLRQAGHSRLHVEALAVPRRLGDVPLDEVEAFGARADEAHLTIDDVDELRDLVDAEPAKEAAHGCDARVVLLGEHRAAGLFGILDHGAQLVHAERLHAPADALL